MLLVSFLRPIDCLEGVVVNSRDTMQIKYVEPAETHVVSAYLAVGCAPEPVTWPIEFTTEDGGAAEVYLLRGVELAVEQRHLERRASRGVEDAEKRPDLGCDAPGVRSGLARRRRRGVR